jgi:hypothetical protein
MPGSSLANAPPAASGHARHAQCEQARRNRSQIQPDQPLRASSGQRTVCVRNPRGGNQTKEFAFYRSSAACRSANLPDSLHSRAVTTAAGCGGVVDTPSCPCHRSAAAPPVPERPAIRDAVSAARPDHPQQQPCAPASSGTCQRALTMYSASARSIIAPPWGGLSARPTSAPPAPILPR